MFKLRKGNLTLSELEHGIEGITQKMLLQQLNELQRFGLVSKKVFPGYPLHVEYYLTEQKGRRMLEAIQIMQEIGIEYLDEHGMKRKSKTPLEITASE